MSWARWALLHLISRADGQIRRHNLAEAVDRVEEDLLRRINVTDWCPKPGLSSHRVFTLDQKPHFADRVDSRGQRSWPRFRHHGEAKRWGRLLDAVVEHQILIWSADERLAAVGHTMPLVWNGALPDLRETIGITREVGPR